jgi:hypothetical protein
MEKAKKDEQIKLITSLFTITPKGLDFKPWLEKLREKLKTDPDKYKIFLKDSMEIWCTTKHYFPSTSNLSDSEFLYSLTPEEYKEFVGNFLFWLGGLYLMVCDARLDYQLDFEYGKNNILIKPLPTPEEIEDIGWVFDYSID